MSFLECNLFEDSDNRLIYEKPYNKLFMSKYKNGEILIRVVRYMETCNNTALGTSMFFFDNTETEVLFEWLTKQLVKNK